MGNKYTLPGLALLGGALGFGIRRIQWATGYDPDTQLFLSGSPATYGLLALTAVLALLFVVLLRPLRREGTGLAVLNGASPPYTVVTVAAGMLFFVACVLGVLEGLDQLEIWQHNPAIRIFTYPLSLLLSAGLALPAGFATLMLGRSVRTDRMSVLVPILVCFPPLSALAWVFSYHIAHGTDPVLMGYGIPLAAAGLLLLSHYFTAALFHDRPHPRLCVFTGLMGTVLGLISLADGPSLFQTILTEAFILSALSTAWVILSPAAPAEKIPE